MTLERPSDVTDVSDLDSMNRRSFVSTLTAAGFTLGTALGLAADDVQGTESGMTPIVVGYSRADDPEEGLSPNKKEVPTRWHDALADAKAVKEDFVDGNPIADYRYEDAEVQAVFVMPGEKDGQQPYVQLEVTDEHTLPLGYSQEDGVDITIREVDEYEPESDPKPTGHHTPSSERDPGPPDVVPAGEGWTLVNPDEDESDIMGSLTTPVVPQYPERSTNVYFISHAHWEDLPPEEGFKMGRYAEIVDIECGGSGDSNDFAIGEPKDGYIPEFRIRNTEPQYPTDQEYVPGRVDGFYTEAGLVDAAEDDTIAKKTGKTTGTTSGELKSANGSVIIGFDLPCTSRSHRSPVFKWGDADDASPGDSGSAVYIDDPPEGDLWVVGQVDAKVRGGPLGYIFGVPAYHMRSEYDYEMAPSISLEDYISDGIDPETTKRAIDHWMASWIDTDVITGEDGLIDRTPGL